MDWFAAVDIYCERTSAAFWAEPVNALTNLAVLGPVVWAVSTARRLGERDPAVWVLIGLGAAIGAGSFLFHTVATRWTEVADTLPIWSFWRSMPLSARIGCQASNLHGAMGRLWRWLRRWRWCS